MSVKVSCENGHRLNAPESLVGKKVKCPKCGVQVLVQASGANPSASPNSQPNSFDVASSNSQANEGFVDFGVGGFDDHSSPPGSLYSDADFASMPSAAAQPTGYNWGPAAQPNMAASPAPSKKAVSINPVFLSGSIASGGFLAVCTLGIMWFIVGSLGSGAKDVTATPIVIADTAPTVPSETPTTPVDSKVADTSDAWVKFIQARPETDISRHDEYTVRSVSNLIQKELTKFVDAQAQVGKVEKSKIVAEEIRQSKVPFFLETTDDETSSLMNNVKDPKVQARIELLEFGLEEFGIEGWDPKAGREDTALNERMYADMLAYRWRHYLMIKKVQLDEKKYRLIRHIEDKCFGVSSLFYAFSLTDDNKMLERIDATFESFGRIFEKMRSKRINPYGYPAIRTAGLSWRVAMLQYMQTEDKALYKEFKLDEPWDSEANLKLLEKMPDCFKSSKVDKPGYTSFHMVIHERGYYLANPNQEAQDSTSAKGGSGTPVIILAGAEMAVPWTKPGGLDFDPTKDASQFGTPPVRNYYPFFAYGIPTTKYFLVSAPRATLETLFFIDDEPPERMNRIPGVNFLRSYYSPVAELQTELWKQALKFEK